MNWQRTREHAIARWGRVRDGLGHERLVALIAEVDTLTGLCAKAEEAGSQSAARCDLCVALRDVGGCARVGAQITTALRAEDWGRVDVYVAEVLQMLRDAGPPADPDRSAG